MKHTFLIAPAAFAACLALAFFLSACEDNRCAGEGEQYSAVYPEYPDACCEGLTAWESGMDTRVSVGDACYETGLLAGSPVGTCIDCGNGVCDELETVCNCEADCAGGINSDYADADAFCAEYWSEAMAAECDNGTLAGNPICGLCPPDNLF